MNIYKLAKFGVQFVHVRYTDLLRGHGSLDTADDISSLARIIDIRAGDNLSVYVDIYRGVYFCVNPFEKPKNFGGDETKSFLIFSSLSL